jgi:hypothetical protein
MFELYKEERMKKYRYELTCGACPEQYDVYDIDDKQVAYVRLRHGYLYCSVPYSGGEVIYEAYPKGDGIFEEDEREKYLQEIDFAIHKHKEQS